jgi:hypothetical protein
MRLGFWFQVSDFRLTRNEKLETAAALQPLGIVAVYRPYPV